MLNKSKDNKETNVKKVKRTNKTENIGNAALKETSKSKTVSKKQTSETSKKSNTKSALESSKAQKKVVANTKTVKKSTKSSAKKPTTQTQKNNSKKTVTTAEYYDLPYRYNETVVKILAQTPTTLFIYWDISDKDRNSYIEQYGEDFFNNTKPILIVTNKTMNYSFEIEINDFANSWYLHVNDANCDYSVELGRRPINYSSNIDNFVHITTSNDMEMPNNRILFDRLGKSVFFKNVKNNFIEEKQISSMSFIKNIGKAQDIYELYKEIYNGEINAGDLTSNNLQLNLSSSNSSTFK